MSEGGFSSSSDTNSHDHTPLSTKPHHSPEIRTIFRPSFAPNSHSRSQISRSNSPLKYQGSVLSSPNLLKEPHRYIKLHPRDSSPLSPLSELNSRPSSPCSPTSQSASPPALLSALSPPPNPSAHHPKSKLSKKSSIGTKSTASLATVSSLTSDRFDSVVRRVSNDPDLSRMHSIAKLPRAGRLCSSLADVDGAFDRTESNKEILSLLSNQSVDNGNWSLLVKIFDSQIVPRLRSINSKSNEHLLCNHLRLDSDKTNHSWVTFFDDAGLFSPVKHKKGHKQGQKSQESQEQSFLDLELTRLELKSQYDSAYSAGLSLSPSDLIGVTVSHVGEDHNSHEVAASQVNIGLLYFARVATIINVNQRFLSQFLNCGEVEFGLDLLYECFVLSRLLLTSLGNSDLDDVIIDSPPVGFTYSDPTLEKLFSSFSDFSTELQHQAAFYFKYLVSILKTISERTSNLSYLLLLNSQIENVLFNIETFSISELSVEFVELIQLKTEICCKLTSNNLSIGNSYEDSLILLKADLIRYSNFLNHINKDFVISGVTQSLNHLISFLLGQLDLERIHDFDPCKLYSDNSFQSISSEYFLDSNGEVDSVDMNEVVSGLNISNVIPTELIPWFCDLFDCLLPIKSPILAVCGMKLSAHFLINLDFPKTLYYLLNSLKCCTFVSPSIISINQLVNFLIWFFACFHSVHETLQFLSNLSNPIETNFTTRNQSNYITSRNQNSNQSFVSWFDSFLSQLDEGIKIGSFWSDMSAIDSFQTCFSSITHKISNLRTVHHRQQLINQIKRILKTFYSSTELCISYTDVYSSLEECLEDLADYDEIKCRKEEDLMFTWIELIKVVDYNMRYVTSLFSRIVSERRRLGFCNKKKKHNLIKQKNCFSLIQLLHESKLVLTDSLKISKVLAKSVLFGSKAAQEEITRSKFMPPLKILSQYSIKDQNLSVFDKLSSLLWSRLVKITVDLSDTLLQIFAFHHSWKRLCNSVTMLTFVYHQRPLFLSPFSSSVCLLWNEIQRYPTELVKDIGEGVCFDYKESYCKMSVVAHNDDVVVQNDDVFDSDPEDLVEFDDHSITEVRVSKSVAGVSSLPKVQLAVPNKEIEFIRRQCSCHHPFAIQSLLYLGTQYYKEGFFDHSKILLLECLEVCLNSPDIPINVLVTVWNDLFKIAKQTENPYELLSWLNEQESYYKHLKSESNEAVSKYLELLGEASLLVRQDKVSHTRYLYQLRYSEEVSSSVTTASVARILHLNREYAFLFLKENAHAEVSTVLENSLSLHSNYSNPADVGFLSDWHLYSKTKLVLAKNFEGEGRYVDGSVELEKALAKRPSVVPLHDNLSSRLFDEIFRLRSLDVDQQKEPAPPTETHVFAFVFGEYRAAISLVKARFPSFSEKFTSFSNPENLSEFKSLLKSVPHFSNICGSLAKLLAAGTRFSESITVYKFQLFCMSCLLPTDHHSFSAVWKKLLFAYSQQLRSTRDLIEFIDSERQNFGSFLPPSHCLITLLDSESKKLTERMARLEKWLAVGGFYTLYFVIGIFFFFFAPPINQILSFWNRNTSWTYFLLWSVEFVLLVLALYLVRWPQLPNDSADQRRISRIQRSKTINKCCLVITTHRSADIIAQTLKSALKIFPANKIYIADNGNSTNPLDNTREVVAQCDPSINYHWISTGNKTLATWWTVSYCVQEDFVMTIDDDVLLPQDLVIPLDEFEDGQTKCLAFTIRADNLCKANGKLNIIAHFQDVEYKLAGLFKLFQSKIQSSLCPHGAISMWERETFMKVLKRHNCTFHGEDLQCGLVLHELNKNYRIATVGRVCVPTTVPDHLLCRKLFKCKCASGYSLLVQRIKSWDITAHRFSIRLIGLLLFYWKRNTFVLKPFIIFELWTVIMDWIRVSLLIYIIMQNPFVFLLGMTVTHAIYTIFLVFFNYWVLRDRHDLRSPILVVLLFPFYRYLLLLFRAIALVHNLLYYTPFVRNRIAIKDRNDLPLPPKFEEEISLLSTVEEGDFDIVSCEKFNFLVKPKLPAFVLNHFNSPRSKIFKPVNSWFSDIFVPANHLNTPALHLAFLPPEFNLYNGIEDLCHLTYPFNAMLPNHVLLANLVCFLSSTPLALSNDCSVAIKVLELMYVVGLKKMNEANFADVRKNKAVFRGLGEKVSISQLRSIITEYILHMLTSINSHSLFSSLDTSVFFCQPLEVFSIEVGCLTTEKTFTIDQSNPLSSLVLLDSRDPLVLIVPLSGSFSVPGVFGLVVVNCSKSIVCISAPSGFDSSNLYKIVLLLDSIEPQLFIRQWNILRVRDHSCEYLSWSSVVKRAEHKKNSTISDVNDSLTLSLDLDLSQSGEEITFNGLWLDPLVDLLQTPIVFGEMKSEPKLVGKEFIETCDQFVLLIEHGPGNVELHLQGSCSQ
ncbi:hypothetical protein P9112_012090 [Eukaryota sp. TZLM1-RC]